MLLTALLPAVNAQDEKPTPAPSIYLRLSEEATVTALQLTDEQKTSITQIITELNTALEAEDADKPALTKAAGQKLEAVLTALQQKQLEELFAPKLKFNFRLQKWEAVLDWMADEAGLSLVMDDVPEGAFNYSDSKEYTPTEAIDLLNGWLLTKGFTLVRRERLLMCLNLKEGLPEGAIPRIPLEELAERGRFEFVSVLIPLTGRPAESVVEEVTPLLGTYGEAQALAATGQLLVTDSVSSIRRIETIVEKIPLPTSKPPPAKAVPAELVVYPIQHANPKQAGEVLQQIISGTVVVDETASQISVNATPTQQAKAKIIIGQLESNQGPDKQPVLKLYPARVSDSSELLATMQLVAADGSYRYDAASRKLIAFANAADHVKIAASLAEMLTQQPTGGDTQLEVYPLEHIDASAAQTLLATLLPDTKVTIDSRTGSLIAIGTLQDHKAIQTLLEQLEPATAGRKPAQLKTYPIQTEIASTATSVLSAIVPEATVTLDADNKRLLVVAPPEKHELIGTTLTEVTQNLALPDHELKTYDTKSVDVSSLMSLMSSLAPQAQVTNDSANSRLLVIAGETDHSIVEATLEKLTGTASTEPVLKAYPVRPNIQSSATSILTAVAPGATITSDAESERLLIVATPEQHAQVASTLTELVAGLTDASLSLASYPTEGVDVTSVVSLLSTLNPKAQITNDTANERLLVIGTKEDHDSVTNVLQQVGTVTPDKPILKSYPLKENVSAATVTSLLSSLTPSASVTSDTESQRLLITATDADHQIIAVTLQQIAQDAGGELPQLQFYTLKNAKGDNAVAVLQAMLPAASIRHEADAKRLSVVATKSAHATIAATLEKLETAAPVDEKRTLQIYDVTSQQRARFTTLLNSLTSELPGLQVLADAQPGEMTVWAKPSQHLIVDEILKQLVRDIPPEEKPQLIVYPIRKVDPASVQTVLAELFPDARITVDAVSSRLLIHAKPALHTTIKAAIGQLDSDIDGATEIKLMVYPVKGIDASNAVSLINSEVPKASVIHDTTGQTLIVRARLEHHQEVADLLEALRSASAPLLSKTVVVYPASHSKPTTEQAFFENAFPNATFMIDPVSRTLSALATAEDHKGIQAAIESNAGIGKAAAVLKSYDTKGINTSGLSSMIARSAPDAQVVYTTERLLAWTTVEEHKTIEGILKGLLPESDDRRITVFDVSRTGLSTAQTVIAQVAPGLSTINGIDGKTIIAWVNEETKAEIEQTLEQLAQSPAAAQDRRLKFYDIEAAGGSRATTVLSTVVPAVSFNTTADGKRLMAFVSEQEDSEIQATLKQLTTEKPFAAETVLQLYSIKDLGPAATTVLSNSVPGVSISSGSRPDQIAVVATPANHEKFAKVLAQLNEAKAPADDRQLEIYDIAGADGTALQSVLQPVVTGDVQMTQDPSGRRLFIRAGAEDHKKIKATIDQVLAGLGQDERETKTYFVGSPNGDEAQEVLLALYPDATIVVDADRKMLVATATPEQHEKIATITKQLAGMGTEGERPYSVVYETNQITASQAESLLDNLFTRSDNVKFSANDKSGRLVIVAKKDQHELMTSLLKQFDVAREDEETKQLAAYDVRPQSASTVMTALAPLVSEDTVITAGSTKGEILVTATEEQQAKVAQLVKQLAGSKGALAGMETRTYKLARGEADELQDAMRALFPDATLVTDARDSILVATATPDQHSTIASVAEQMTGSFRGDASPVPKSWRLNQADGNTMLEVLDNLFTTADNVKLSLDQRNKTIVAVARPDQHDLIQQLLAELDPATGERAFVMQTYPVHGLDAGQVRQVVDDVLRDRFPGTRVHLEGATGNILLTTTEAGHKLAKETIARFRPPPPKQLEVFQLSYIDAGQAHGAIDRVISSRFPHHMLRPVIHTEHNLQQLWIRATPEQLKEIRELLIKMGESGLHLTNGTSGGNLRIIPIGRDTEAALKQIQNLWPQVRPNPLRVVTPQRLEQNESESVPQFSLPAEDPQTPIPAAVDEKKVGEQQAAQPPKSDVPPVVIVPSGDRLTIASEDEEALNQLELLLRTIAARRTPGRNQDFSVYRLKNAGASDVSTTLQQIFEDSEGLTNFGKVAMVADERLNALIVYASRMDRQRIETLLEILDSDKFEDSKRAYQTEIIPVVHSSASSVLNILEGVYRPQMSTGGARSTISIPSGVPSDVATVLRQINAAAAAPLLTIEVQANTNSLVLKAPKELLEEVIALIEKLDSASHDTSARNITVLPLKKASTARVMEILQGVLDN